jgi:hypothetical protein
MFKNILSVVDVPGGFAVAIDKVPTGQVYTKKDKAQDQVNIILAERKAKREAAKEASDKLAAEANTNH